MFNIIEDTYSEFIQDIFTSFIFLTLGLNILF